MLDKAKRNDKGWNSSRSLVLSKVLIVIFGIVLLVVDIQGYWIVKFLLERMPSHLFVEWATEILLTYLYVCSVPAYIVLIQLFRLLGRISNGEVFTMQNTTCLRSVSWCCLLVGMFSVPFIAMWFSIALVALAAGLAGLILRVVKNVFEQAVKMKDELELTI